MSTKPSDQKTLNLKLAASAEDGDVVMVSQILSLGANPLRRPSRGSKPQRLSPAFMTPAQIWKFGKPKHF